MKVERTELETLFQNVYIGSKGGINKIGYKTEKGLLSLIKKVNKSCLKYGYRTELVLQFPVKRSHNQKIDF